jgi:hypothetical protein
LDFWWAWIWEECPIVSNFPAARKRRFITLENNYSVAYFFCDDKDDQLSSAHAMLANVLGQLLRQDPKLIENFEKESDDSDEWEKISWSSRMLERVFDRIIQTTKWRKIFLIIDALGIASKSH